MDMERYSVVEQKQPREIVLLRGRGCVYKRCTFCDYHLDKSPDDGANLALNAQVLSRVTGQFGELEVINSGSVFELDDATLALIRQVCEERGIHTLHFEAHWLYRERIAALREQFAPLALKMKLGLESFDYDLREGVLKKGIAERDPALIAQGFDEANFLVGITGQSVEGLARDFELGLAHFERICVNVMCRNTTPVEPDAHIIAAFMERLYPALEADPRVDVLVNNTDFGVGA